jgi:triosephosphate isomerase
MSKKLLKAVIGGNWKANGTVESVKALAEVLNKAGSFSPNSEVVIAAPSIHLQSLKSIIRPDISVAAQDVSFKTGYGAFTGLFLTFFHWFVVTVVCFQNRRVDC